MGGYAFVVMASYPKRQAEPEEPELSPEERLDREDWLRLSALGLEEAYGEDEPEYSLDLIKKPNPEYEGR